MTKRAVLVSAVASLVALSLVLGSPDRGRAQGLAGQATPNRTARAVELLTDLVKGNDKAIVASFNARMARALTASRLAHDWGIYQTVFGRYLGHGRPVAVLRGTLIVVRVPLRMALRPGEFRITFQPDGRVAGLYLLRTGVPL